MAGPSLPLDLQGSLTALASLLNVAAGVPGSTAQYTDGPFVFPQVGGDGVQTLPDGSTATNALTKLEYEIVSIVGLGVDELRNPYDADTLIAGDTYEPDPEDPDARLGAILPTMQGNRIITLQVKAETQAPSAAGAWQYIERIRTRLGLESFNEALEAVGLAVNDMREARPFSYTDDSGRTVQVVIFELVLNAADSAQDDPVTTIEQLGGIGFTPKD
jgi:hypothetical protein